MVAPLWCYLESSPSLIHTTSLQDIVSLPEAPPPPAEEIQAAGDSSLSLKKKKMGGDLNIESTK